MPFFKYKNKDCYYEEAGNGDPLLFLHGNCASSRMYKEISKHYQRAHKVILFDFLGHGLSERIESFPIDLFYEESMQIIAFLKSKNYKNVSLIGSSGGALVAINVALECPELIKRVIADSFEGERPLKKFVENIELDRKNSKRNPKIRKFYEQNHGIGWQDVVDNDTKALSLHYKNIGNFFHKPIEELKTEILFTASEQDEYADKDFYKNTYSNLVEKAQNARMHIFSHGKHPSILTNFLLFKHLSLNFLKNGHPIKLND